MTLQPLNQLEDKQSQEKQDVSEAKRQFMAARKNTMSAFVPIKDNVSKKSMDEASMFLKNSCLKPEQALQNGEIQGFSVPVANFIGGRRESDIGLFNSNSKDNTTPFQTLKNLLGGGEGGFDAKDRQDSLLNQERKLSNYVQVFNSIYNYKINSEKKEGDRSGNDHSQRNETSRNDASNKNETSHQHKNDASHD